MAVDEQLEIERKYDAPADATVPDLSTAPGIGSVADPVEHELVATYFDTPDLRLLAARVTMRRRVGGADEGWHLKVPGRTTGRRELRLPLTGRAEDEVPPELRTIVLGLVRAEPLVPVARLRTHRTVRVLADEDGRPVAELSDDVVTAETLLDEPGRQEWREWELELLDGTPELLDAVEPVLLEAGAAPAAGPSKVGRVLAGRLQAAEEESEEGPAKQDTSTAALLTAHLRRHTERLHREDLQLRSGEHEGVHQMRIAARRLRSALATYRPVLAPGTTAALRDELRWLGQVLADARDAQVLRERLTALAADQPAELLLGAVERRISGELSTAFAEGRRRAEEALLSERYLRLLDDLDAFVVDPPFTDRADEPAASVLPGLLRRDLRRVRKRRKAWRRSPAEERDRRLHEVRKAAKRLRYAAESAVPVLGEPAEDLAAAAKQVQQVLGEHQDTVVARAVLRDMGARAHLDGDNGFSFGILHGLEEARAVELEADFAAAWTKLPGKRFGT